LDVRGQTLGRSVRYGVELAPQGLLQVLVLPQRLVALAGSCEQTHQPRVSLLMRWLLGDRPLESGSRLGGLAARLARLRQLQEERKIRLAERLAPGRGPVLIAIFGEQITAVLTDRRVVVSRLADLPGGRGSSFEGINVDPKLTSRAEEDPVILGEQRRSPEVAGRVKGSASDVERMAEVPGRGARLEVGPEQVEDLVAVQGVVAGQGEQLEQAFRLA
jgi:hypothetical protein